MRNNTLRFYLIQKLVHKYLIFVWKTYTWMFDWDVPFGD